MATDQLTPKRVITGAVALALLVFCFDALSPQGQTSAMLYVAVVGATLWLPGSRPIFVLTALGTLLPVLAFIVAPPGLVMIDLFERAFSILAIWIVALLCLFYKR